MFLYWAHCIAVTACSPTGRGHSTPRGCALRAPQSNEAAAALWSQAGHEERGECQPGKAVLRSAWHWRETDPVSLFTGLPDTSAAGSRLAAGHPGSPPGPRGAPTHPVLRTGTRGSLTATIPHPPTTPVPISLWLCFLGPEAQVEQASWVSVRCTVPCQGWSRGPQGSKKLRGPDGARPEHK